jgi:hypothetical protein
LHEGSTDAERFLYGNVYKLQTAGNYPKESIKHTKNGESLKSRTRFLIAHKGELSLSGTNEQVCHLDYKQQDKVLTSYHVMFRFAHNLSIGKSIYNVLLSSYFLPSLRHLKLISYLNNFLNKLATLHLLTAPRQRLI